MADTRTLAKIGEHLPTRSNTLPVSGLGYRWPADVMVTWHELSLECGLECGFEAGKAAVTSLCL